MDYNIILGKSTLTNVSDAYSGTLNVSYSQYTNNGVYLCKIDTTNTTISPTLSLNGLTAYPIKRNDGTSILVGELKVDAWYLFMFDQSTSTFEILNLSIPYFNGTTNYVAKYTPTGNVLGISQIFDNGTNVGIGTATPTSKLQIVGTDSTSSNYSLKIDNSANSPLLYVRNDNRVLINRDNIDGLTNAVTYIKYLGGIQDSAPLSLQVESNLVETALAAQTAIYVTPHDTTINTYLRLIQIRHANNNGGIYLGSYYAGLQDTDLYFKSVAAGTSNPIIYMDNSTSSVLIDQPFATTAGAKLHINGNIKTAQPSVNGAGAWKLGKKVTATVSLVTTDYIEIEIDSVVYKLALVS